MEEEEDAPPSPFIIDGVERPLDAMLSMSMRVLLILKHTETMTLYKENQISFRNLLSLEAHQCEFMFCNLGVCADISMSKVLLVISLDGNVLMPFNNVFWI